jgi:hypothetical protein
MMRIDGIMGCKVGGDEGRVQERIVCSQSNNPFYISSSLTKNCYTYDAQRHVTGYSMKLETLYRCAIIENI